MENLGEKFVEHQKALFGYALYLTHNACDAQELMQETALSVLRGAGSYHEKGQFVQWIHTIMRNCYINQIKRNQRICIGSGYDVFDESCTITAVAEESADSTYITAEMNCMIDELPAAHALACRLPSKGIATTKLRRLRAHRFAM